jgi:hypothetical protein
MTDERLPDGPDVDEVIQLIRDSFPDAVVATIDSAAFFSLDEKHWPNFARHPQRDPHAADCPGARSAGGA